MHHFVVFRRNANWSKVQIRKFKQKVDTMTKKGHCCGAVAITSIRLGKFFVQKTLVS